MLCLAVESVDPVIDAGGGDGGGEIRPLLQHQLPNQQVQAQQPQPAQTQPQPMNGETQDALGATPQDAEMEEGMSTLPVQCTLHPTPYTMHNAQCTILVQCTRQDIYPYSLSPLPSSLFPFDT